MTLKLWKVWREEGAGWDEYEGCVVAAHTEAQALACDPSESGSGWLTRAPQLRAECVGLAAQGISEGDIVIAAFNAG